MKLYLFTCLQKQMGFQSTRGLGRRMRLPEMDTRISPERLADMEKFLRTNGIEVSDNVLDFDEVFEIFFLNSQPKHKYSEEI